MNQELLQPSLRHGGVRETKSFDIGYLFYIGLFGGLLPVLVLGTVNAFWLRMQKNVTAMLLIFGIGLHFSVFFYTWKTGSGREAFLFSRVAAVLLGICYQWVLRKRYRLHSVLHGVHRPLTKPAVLLSLTGLLVDVLLIQAGEGLHDASVA